MTQPNIDFVRESDEMVLASIPRHGYELPREGDVVRLPNCVIAGVSGYAFRVRRVIHDFHITNDPLAPGRQECCQSIRVILV